MCSASMATHGSALPMLGGSLPFLSAKAGNEESRLPPGRLLGRWGPPLRRRAAISYRSRRRVTVVHLLAARCSVRTLPSLLLRGFDRWRWCAPPPLIATPLRGYFFAPPRIVAVARSVLQ